MQNKMLIFNDFILLLNQVGNAQNQDDMDAALADIDWWTSVEGLPENRTICRKDEFVRIAVEWEVSKRAETTAEFVEGLHTYEVSHFFFRRKEVVRNQEYSDDGVCKCVSMRNSYDLLIY